VLSFGTQREQNSRFEPHEYDAIREDMFFEIATKDLPGLYAAAAEALRLWNLHKLP